MTTVWHRSTSRHAGLTGLLQILTALAGALDEHPSPISYTRRRTLFPASAAKVNRHALTTRSPHRITAPAGEPSVSRSDDACRAERHQGVRRYRPGRCGGTPAPQQAGDSRRRRSTANGSSPVPGDAVLD